MRNSERPVKRIHRTVQRLPTVKGRKEKKRTNRGLPSTGDENESDNGNHAETAGDHVGDVPQ